MCQGGAVPRGGFCFVWFLEGKNVGVWCIVFFFFFLSQKVGGGGGGGSSSSSDGGRDARASRARV